MDTTNIFEAFLRGEPRGFKLIYFTYQYPLKEFARRLVQGREDAADDAVSDAFTLLWEWRGTLQSDIHIQRFLYLVVRRNCKKERSILERWFNKLPPQWDKIDPLEWADLKELNAHNQWIVEKIRLQLAELPEQQAEDFYEYYFNCKRIKDIARERGAAAGTVRTNVQQAMKKIREYLQTNKYPGYSKKS